MSRYRLILAAAGVLLVAAFVPAAGAAPNASARSARPVLRAISPTVVPAEGAVIAVGGTGLDGAHSVSFGRTVVSDVHHVSPTRLTVRAPRHAVGRVAVTLHSANGPSQTAHLDYVRPPAPLHWHTDPGIDPSRGDLTSISCVTENFCVAVERDPGTRTRLLRFGTHIAPKSTSIPRSADVRNVACGSNHFCVAGPATGAYIWSGSHWAGPKRLGSHLPNGPVCARGTSTCLYYSSTRTLIHKPSHWASSPMPTGLQAYGISCASARFCEALVVADSPTRHFARYDGSRWRFDRTAPSLTYSKIACAAPKYCLATSADSFDDDAAKTAVFDGSTWAI